MSASSGRPARSLPGEALYKEHIARFQMLLQSQPDQAAAQYGFSLLHSTPESAGAEFLENQGLGDGSWFHRFQLAVAQHQRGDMDGAEKQYKALLDESKSHREIEFNLAMLYSAKGDDAQARKRLDAFEKWLDECEKRVDLSRDAHGYVAECRENARALRAELDQN